MYVQAKDDPIDSALADYLNNLDIPLQVPFVRESKGIYIFGTKRVFIKLQNGKLIIRVGGGYMRIEEFINIYTPLELEKSKEKNPGDHENLSKAILGQQFDSSPQSNTGYAACYAVPKYFSLANDN